MNFKLIIVLIALLGGLYYTVGLRVMAFLALCLLDAWLLFRTVVLLFHGLLFAALVSLALTTGLLTYLLGVVDTNWPSD